MQGFSIDTYTFFLIGMSGFMTVWTFRKAAGFKQKFSDFEYIGFSAFVGLSIIFVLEWLSKDPSKISQMFNNPFAGGFALAIIGIFFGAVVGWTWRGMLGINIEIKRIFGSWKNAAGKLLSVLNARWGKFVGGLCSALNAKKKS